MCVVAAPAEMTYTNATWRMRHALRGVALDGLAARRVITVASGAFVASCPRPVVVEEVTDVDKAASCSSAVLMAVAPTWSPVADDGTPGEAVTSVENANPLFTRLASSLPRQRRRQFLRIRWRLWWGS